MKPAELKTAIKAPRPVFSHTATVLRAFLALEPDEMLAGIDVMKRSGLRSGTVYPILKRLREAEWLDSQLEKGGLENFNRRSMRFYWLTDLGREKAQKSLSSL